MECLVDLVTAPLIAQWGCLPYTIGLYIHTSVTKNRNDQCKKFGSGSGCDAFAEWLLTPEDLGSN